MTLVRSLAALTLTAAAVSGGGTVALAQTPAAPGAPAAPSAPARPSAPAAHAASAPAQQARTTAKHTPGPAGYTFLRQCVTDDVTNRPRRFTVACADANQYLDRLQWKRWGQRSARAKGVMTVNTCAPSCAKGKLKNYPVSVRAHRIVRGEAAQFYSRLTVTYTKSVPTGERRTHTYVMP